jgi:hypothetical protein
MDVQTFEGSLASQRYTSLVYPLEPSSSPLGSRANVLSVQTADLAPSFVARSAPPIAAEEAFWEETRSGVARVHWYIVHANTLPLEYDIPSDVAAVNGRGDPSSHSIRSAAFVKSALSKGPTRN